jgi:signal peptidase I
MSPTINPGQVILTKPFHPRQDILQRYDIVAFHSPVNTQKVWVMRVVALPREQVLISTNALFINGVEAETNQMPQVLIRGNWLTPQLLESGVPRQWSVKKDEVFVVGDNLNTSNDSRFWGPLKLSQIVGVVMKVKGS